MSHPARAELNLPRYKFMVQVMIGEQRGQGIRTGTRAFWDNDTDNYASESFSNDSLFAVAVVFGAYFN